MNRMNQKLFITEEKMVKEMQTLSLDLFNLTNNKNDNNSDDETNSSPSIYE